MHAWGLSDNNTVVKSFALQTAKWGLIPGIQYGT